MTIILITIILCLSATVICYAGDIISPLMLQEDAQVYFGEIKSITNDRLVIIQKKNVKGDFEQDKEYLYQRTDFTTLKDLKVGKTYLCTVPDTRKNLMIWEVTSMDTDTLKVLDNHTFAKQIEQYMNEGLFEQAEIDRVAKNNQLKDTFITRERFCEMIYNKIVETKDIKLLDTTNSPFKDTNNPKIELLYQEGIVYGKGENKFIPNGEILRAEVATIIYRVAVYLGMDIPQLQDKAYYNDEIIISYWAKDPVRYVCQTGLMTGINEYEFFPFGGYTIGQAKEIINKLITYK